jgi:aquaporin Z
MEVCEIGVFIIMVGALTTLFEYPGSALRQALPEPGTRRALRGCLVGATGAAIVYSPFGSRSGAHLNPAVTLTFLRLGRVAAWDAVFYVSAQFVGACLGIGVISLAIGSPFIQPPVAALATRPGTHGVGIAFAAELVMAFLLMLLLLACLSARRIAPLTGVLVGAVGAVYIFVAEPLSGAGLNPASSFASALREGLFDFLWVYFVAPPIGMLLAAEGYIRWTRRRPICVKLYHPLGRPCPFLRCGYAEKVS